MMPDEGVKRPNFYTGILFPFIKTFILKGTPSSSSEGSMLRGPGAPGALPDERWHPALPDEWGVPVREMPTDCPYYFDCLNNCGFRSWRTRVTDLRVDLLAKIVSRATSTTAATAKQVRSQGVLRLSFSLFGSSILF